MKKALILILLSFLIFNLTYIPVGASGYSWFIKRRPNDTPLFSEDAEFALKHSSFGYDTSAYKNGDKVIYLTFDAGYENGNIEKILDVLNKENVKATFFILSNLVNKNTNLVKRMISEGHVLGNHTKNHKNMTTLTDEEMRLNLKTLEDLVYSRCDYVMPKIFRYPEGIYNERTVLNAEKLGYKTFFWSATYADWDNNRQPDSEFAKNQLLNYSHPGMIVLLHPTSDTNAKILGDLITTWKSLGYRFDTVDKIK